MARHTPGPWTVVTGVCRNDHPDTSADVRGPTGEPVANCWCHEASIANARLIAAAPDLLNVAHAAYHALKSYEHGNVAPDLAKAVTAALDLTIAKAEAR
jgi:hypothetical protein